MSEPQRACVPRTRLPAWKRQRNRPPPARKLAASTPRSNNRSIAARSGSWLQPSVQPRGPIPARISGHCPLGVRGPAGHEARHPLHLRPGRSPSRVARRVPRPSPTPGSRDASSRETADSNRAGHEQYEEPSGTSLLLAEDPASTPACHAIILAGLGPAGHFPPRDRGSCVAHGRAAATRATRTLAGSGCPRTLAVNDSRRARAQIVGLLDVVCAIDFDLAHVRQAPSCDREQRSAVDARFQTAKQHFALASRVEIARQRRRGFTPFRDGVGSEIEPLPPHDYRGRTEVRIVSSARWKVFGLGTPITGAPCAG